MPRSRRGSHSLSSTQTADDGLRLHCFIRALFLKSLSVNTLKMYDTAWKLFADFKSTYPPNGAGHIQYLLSFVTFCHSHLKLSHSTIKLYLSGIRHFHSLTHPDQPSLFSTHPVRAILRGIKKSGGTAGTTCKLVSGHLFRTLSDALSNFPFGFRLSLLIKTAIYIAFYGFLRPGEFLCTSSTFTYVRKDQVSWHDTYFILTLYSSKTLALGQTIDVMYFPTDNAWCPVTVIQEWLIVSSNEMPDKGDLFSISSAPLTSSMFIKRVRILLVNLGVNPQSISGHSCRIGATSAASKNNISVHIIKRLGWWKFACYSRYIPDPHCEMLSVFKTLLL
ncbi:uncharacterized protein LOC130283157 [Hyla sarda]|uniref:uncharacterized protein LOC130283157 n=1 Tax=Hyla sarda TaxID=327740 RepID=UPI0024C2FBD8|nr:uncharacterized protein LOC130283157 [Hyla sarda]